LLPGSFLVPRQPHTQEQAFLQVIVENPGDESTWLVLADWPEEQDDPKRAELLRLHRRLLATCCEPAHPARADWQSRMVELLAEGVHPCVPRRTVTLGKDVEMTFSWIPPGEFLMGSPETEEDRHDDEPLRRMTAPGFWLRTKALPYVQSLAPPDGRRSPATRFRGQPTHTRIRLQR
jgi:uncharacterized protein (TIGR02996 family)